MKKIYCLVSYFLFLTSFIFAQQEKIDSLENLLKAAKEDSTRIVLLNLLAGKYGNINLDKSVDYANKALEVSEKSGNQKFKSKSFIALGIAYRIKGDYEKSLECMLSSLKINETLYDSIEIAGLLNQIGEIYRFQKNYQKAMEYHLLSLEKMKILSDKAGIANALNNIGIIHYYQNDNQKALEYYSQALKLREEIGDKNAIARALGNIAIVYGKQNKFKEAIDYFKKSLQYKEELGDRIGIAYALGNIGSLYVDMKEYLKAKNYFEQALQICIEINSKQLILAGYETLFDVSARMNNFQKAYQYHQLYSQMKDSLFNEESSKQITEMQTKYDTEKKEQQIKLLNKDKEIQNKDLERQKTIRNAVVGGLLLVILFSFVLINRLLLIRKQKKLIEIEREKSEKLLLNILPKETADELKLKNAVTPKRYDQVTVMFTDFKGFTTIAEKMSAEELVSELDFIFKKFDEIISKYPIEKIKTIGDAYMCAGGLPLANTTNPMDVVMAALEIQEFMCLTPNPSPKERGELPPLRGGHGWGLRIGIHTGSVIAGIVGDKKFAYDIWGDTVNTASRMESSGEAGKVNISGETYKMLVGTRHAVSLRFTFRGKIPAKNKGEIEMYFVEKINQSPKP